MLFTVIAMMVGLLVWFVSATTIDKNSRVSVSSKRVLSGVLFAIYVLLIPFVLYIRFYG